MNKNKLRHRKLVGYNRKNTNLLPISEAFVIQYANKIVRGNLLGLLKPATCALLLISYILTLLLFTTVIRGEGGALDATFNNSGKLIRSFSNFEDQISDVAIQPDEKIVAVGRIGFQPGVTSAFGVARFNTDGSIDKSFGNAGSTTTTFNNQFSWAEAVAIQSDGKIIVVGFSGGPDGRSNIAVARFLSNGELDPAFSHDGRGEIVLGPASTAYDVAIQDDGRIVLAGIANGAVALVRLMSDGSLDRRFGFRGRVFNSVGTGASEAKALRIDRFGRIIIAGETFDSNRKSFLIARYRQNGKIDTSFGQRGYSTVSFGPAQSFAADIAVDANDRIVVTGTYTSGMDGVIAVARMLSNGEMDVSFDNDGKVTTSNGGLESQSSDVEIQTDGKIVIGGAFRSITPPAYTDFILLRYEINGSLDLGFGNAGRVITPMAPKWDAIRALAIQVDGRIVAAGSATDDSEISDFGIARYLSN